MRPQAEINAEIEQQRSEREAIIHRIERTFAVCEDIVKREMEGNMTNPSIQAAEAMREAQIAALRGLRVSGGDCEGAGSVDLETGFADCTLGSACLCAHFNHAIEEALAVLRALPLPEPAPDPREATIARLSAELETASNSVLDALNHLDPIVHALGIEDSFKTPLEAIAEKDAAIARLSAELRESFDAGAEHGSDEATAYEWGAPSRLSRDEAFREYLRDQEHRSRAVLTKLSEKEPNP